MSDYLLDTNVLSEAIRKRPDRTLMARLDATPTHRLTTSAICVTELRYGSARRDDRQAFWKRIADGILPRLRILPFGVAEALRAGDVFAQLEASGTKIGLEDVLIGATALEQGLTVVTRNVRHFDRIPGLVVESWWG